jgi:hypothetical protein
LGNPSVNGYILSSTTGGVRSWIPAPEGGGGGGGGASEFKTIIKLNNKDNTLTLAHNRAITIWTSTYTKTVTIPSDATENLPIGFSVVVVHRGGTNPINIATQSGVTLYSDSTEMLQVYGPNNAVEFIKEDANEWSVYGALRRIT